MIRAVAPQYGFVSSAHDGQQNCIQLSTFIDILLLKVQCCESWFLKNSLIDFLYYYHMKKIDTYCQIKSSYL